MNIQWFPGHMTKTKRAMAEDIKLIDVVVELIDARIPLASQNPDIDSISAGRPRVKVFNKSDLADPSVTEKWVKYFKEKGINSVVINSINGYGIPDVLSAVRGALEDKIKADSAKGLNKNIKMMVVGVPNVGKSSFINKLSRKASTKTGDKPGVTRGKQWIRLGNGYDLLDTPGILWPKFDDHSVGIKLACSGAIKDEILDSEELACCLIGILRKRYINELCSRYKLSDIEGLMDYEVLEAIGRNRGFLRAGGVVDTERASKILLDEFRGGVLGRISLEAPDERVGLND